jgi:hypothetical protein
MPLLHSAPQLAPELGVRLAKPLNEPLGIVARDEFADDLLRLRQAVELHL